MSQTQPGPIRPILLVEDRAIDVDLTKRAFAKRNQEPSNDHASDSILTSLAPKLILIG
jgi:hypothetical protein